jgi:co-chaperonin GroES (HSP10)
VSKLADMAMEEYLATGFDMRCLYPAVLVRVLPKEGTTRSGLILPEVAAKIQYEGIVLRTWGTHKVNWKGKEVIVECEVKPGDHVLFPHWCG